MKCPQKPLPLGGVQLVQASMEPDASLRELTRSLLDLNVEFERVLRHLKLLVEQRESLLGDLDQASKRLASSPRRTL